MMTDYKATLDEMRQMWNAYELHGLDMEGNPIRCEESVKPTAAIVMVLNGHGALYSCLAELEEYHQNDAARVVVLKAEKGEVTVEVRDEFMRGLTALVAGWFDQIGDELRAENERLRGLVRGLGRVGEHLFAGYLKSVQVLTAQDLHLIRGARTVLDQAAVLK